MSFCLHVFSCCLLSCFKNSYYKFFVRNYIVVTNVFLCFILGIHASTIINDSYDLASLSMHLKKQLP